MQVMRTQSPSESQRRSNTVIDPHSKSAPALTRLGSHSTDWHITAVRRPTSLLITPLAWPQVTDSFGPIDKMLIKVKVWSFQWDNDSSLVLFNPLLNWPQFGDRLSPAKRYHLLVSLKQFSDNCDHQIEIDIEPTDKVERIKERVEEKEGIPPAQQRLIFSGKQMYGQNMAAVGVGGLSRLSAVFNNGYPIRRRTYSG